MRFKLLLCFFAALAPHLKGQFSCQAWKQAHLGSVHSSINNNAKSDTFDLHHYHLRLDLTGVQQNQFRAEARIRFSPKITGASRLNLDLVDLQVDSLHYLLPNGQPSQGFQYAYNDSTIQIDLNQALSLGDTAELRVFYQGWPVKDASGWGGFHADQGYYYNLGVGFAANPHTFGRAWFPCYDNFVEKSAYRLEVKSRRPFLPLLSGDSISRIALGGDTVLSSSTLAQPIPTYLVSFALANYQFLRDTIQGTEAPIDILLAARAGDTSALKGSFRNLKATLRAFEQYYGAYRWPRIGYALTTVGAMEHATSIHYPLSLVDGGLSGEDIMAHELAHHWFGNLVTCRTADDMWFNEGMAEYSSHLYSERLYGKAQYQSIIRDNAWNVLNFAASRDGGVHRALFAPPHEYVYGYHVYQKGAMVGHNLRHYLGDSVFFRSLKQLFDDHRWGNLSTAEFRDEMIRISGNSTLSDFWNDWVYRPGFPQFSVEEWQYNDLVQRLNLKIKQRRFAAAQDFQNVPVPVSVWGANGEKLVLTLRMSGDEKVFQGLLVPFVPQAVLCGYEADLLTATGADSLTFAGPGNVQGTFSDWQLEYQGTGQNSAVVLHHLVAPQKKTANPFDFRLSSSHYFTFQGFGADSAQWLAEIPFDGSNRGRDTALLRQGNDSLSLLYRPRGADQWQLYPFQQKVVASPNSRIGHFLLQPVLNGDYAFANTGETLYVVPAKAAHNRGWKVYPNPVEQSLQLEFSTKEAVEYRLIDGQGRELIRAKKSLGEAPAKVELDLSTEAPGPYQLWINGQCYQLIKR